jgi:tetratricopeptide (TPR) repeat protein
MHSLFLLGFFVALNASAAPKFDSSQLSNEAPSLTEAKPKTPTAQKKDQKVGLESGGITPQQMKEQLSAIDLVLKSDLSDTKRLDFLLKKAFLHINLARQQGVQRKSAKEMKSSEDEQLRSAGKDLTTVLGDPKVDAKRKAVAYYLQGMIDFEYDRADEQQAEFIKALELDRTGAHTGSIALSIAERFFDKENFQESLKYYLGYLKEMSPDQVALAYYKAAWCYIGMSDFPKAEKLLVRSLHPRGSTAAIDQDKVRDLAFVGTQFRDEANLIAFGRATFKDKKILANYLFLALKYWHARNAKETKQALSEEILKIQDDPEDRMQTLGYLVSNTRREYFSAQSSVALTRLIREMQRMHLKSTDKAFLGIASELEGDSEHFIRTAAETYIGNMKTQEEMGREKVGQLLVKHLEIHDFLFPQGKRKETLYSIWFDYCADTKSQKCLETLAAKTQPLLNKSAQWTEFATNVRLELLGLLESSSQSSDGEKAFIDAILAFRKDFPESKNSFILAKKLAQIYFKKNNFALAQPYFEEIYKKEPTDENLYRLWFTYFELGNYKSIVDSNENLKYKNQKLTDLKRESSLKLAMNNASSGDFEKYEANIKNFLSSKPEKSKAILAYQDYLSRAYDQKGYDKFLMEWKATPSDIKYNASLIPLRKRGLEDLIDQAKIPEMRDLLTPTETDKEMIFLWLASVFSQNKAISGNEIQQLRLIDDEKKSFLLGLLVLTEPANAISYLKAQKKWTESELQLLLLAIELEQKTDKIELKDDEIKILGSLVPDFIKNKNPSKTEEAIQKLKYPDLKSGAAQYNKAVEELTTKVKQIRVKAIDEIKVSSLERQKAIAEHAGNLEKKTSELILNSPLPNGLSEDQKKKYQDGISEVAQEYVDQSHEFQKLQSTLQAKIDEKNKSIEESNFPMLKLNLWPLPKVPMLPQVLALQKKSNFAVHFYLNNVLAKKKITEIDYYSLRGGLLALEQNSVVMRNYIRDEWHSHHEDSLAQLWISLAAQQK